MLVIIRSEEGFSPLLETPLLGCRVVKCDTAANDVVGYRGKTVADDWVAVCGIYRTQQPTDSGDSGPEAREWCPSALARSWREEAFASFRQRVESAAALYRGRGLKGRVRVWEYFRTHGGAEWGRIEMRGEMLLVFGGGRGQWGAHPAGWEVRPPTDAHGVVFPPYPRRLPTLTGLKTRQGVGLPRPEGWTPPPDPPE